MTCLAPSARRKHITMGSVADAKSMAVILARRFDRVIRTSSDAFLARPDVGLVAFKAGHSTSGALARAECEGNTFGARMVCVIARLHVESLERLEAEEVANDALRAFPKEHE